MALAGFLLLTGACNDDDGGDGASSSSSGSDAESYIEALADTMKDDQAGLGLDDEAATCVATAVVDTFDAAKLKEADITPKEFAETEDVTSLDIEVPADAATGLGEDLKACDVAGDVEGALTTGFMADSGDGFSPGAESCLTDNIDDDELIDAVALTFVGDSATAFEDLVGPAFAACPDAMTEILVASAGQEISAEAKDCVANFVESNTEAVANSFVSGDQQLSQDLAAACPAAAGGG
jgi:hypothetical protein